MATLKDLAIAAIFVSSLGAEVKVWQGKMTLPVSEEGLPDPNPPFDAFATGARFNYPYTLRTSMTGRRVTEDLRALYLENEYLKCSILPDIGGHLYSCTDKISGREMFYANPSLKKQLIGYRGAWAAFGVEFNFPVSHNWMSMSPVDFALRRNADGGGSVIVGNIDRPYGMQWRVELVLRPGSTLLEEKVTLYNRGDVRRRYYWWNNAAAEVGDDSKIYYPMRYSASHGFTYVDTWPVNHAGRDISVVRNHTAGPVSQFVHGSREPFMGVWHPRWNAGVVHYAEYADLPGKKIWSFGVDADGLDWRRALSDNNSGYVEIQAGLFRNQETYAFLEPQASISFSEWWMPVREIGGISRANLHGVVYMHRADGRLHVAMNVNHAVAGARIRVLDGGRALLDTRESLDPAHTFRRDVDCPATSKCTLELRDAKGAPLLVHTEDKYDWTPEAEIHPGAQAAQRSADDPLEVGEDHELNGRLPGAMETYRAALGRNPDNLELMRAAGRLAVTLKDYSAGAAHLQRVLERVSNDAEAAYYLGHAYAGLGDDVHARAVWEVAQRQPQFRPAVRLQLAYLAARDGRRADALDLLHRAVAETAGQVRAGTAEVALLRVTGQKTKARERVDKWLGEDPTSSMLRLERVKLGVADDALWRHLGADPERVLEVAVEYIDLGLYEDAVELLARKYPAHDAAESEPGVLAPQDHPVVAYYRAYCREKLHQPADEDYHLASGLSPRYVFPYRATTLAVLQNAIAHDPKDATAHFLLGDMWMSAGLTDRAIAEWQQARSLNPRIPVLHRNLGRTLFALKNDDNAAIEIFREGLKVDPTNTELYSGLTQALSIVGRPAAERVQVLEAYPDRAGMPSSLALDLALSYAEAGRSADAEHMFRGRHFEKQEGGTNVRQVYLEVEMRHALDLARAHKSQEARTLASAIGSPQEDMEFTRDGMDAYLRNPRFAYYRGLIEKLAGDDASARRHFELAAQGRGVYAGLAARQLGRENWRELIGGGGGRRGDASVDRGMALLAMGSEAEGKHALIEVLRAPDRNLSHYMARTALAGDLQ